MTKGLRIFRVSSPKPLVHPIHGSTTSSLIHSHAQKHPAKEFAITVETAELSAVKNPTIMAMLWPYHVIRELFRASILRTRKSPQRQCEKRAGEIK